MPGIYACLGGVQGLTWSNFTGELFMTSTSLVRSLLANGTITTYAGGGIMDSDGIPATSAKLSPSFTALDPTTGDLIFSDESYRVKRVFSNNGTIVNIAGTGTSGYSDGSALSSMFKNPSGLAVGPNGEIYIADSYGNRIRKLQNGMVTTVAGKGTMGYTGDGGLATAATLRFPFSVEVSSNGSVLFIADTYNNAIRRVDLLNGNIATLATGLSYPYDMEMGPDGDLYVADSGNNRVVKINSQGNVTVVAGTGVSGYSGDGGNATSAMFNYPQALTFNQKTSDLYISDTSNNLVRVLYANGTVNTIAGQCNKGLFAGDGGLATMAALYNPSHAFMTKSGDLLISEYGGYMIRRVNGSTGIISTFAGNGYNAYGGGNGVEALYTALTPAFVQEGDNGLIYYSDSYSSLVRVINSTIVTTVAGNLESSFNMEPTPATGTAINNNQGIHVVGQEFYLADADDHAIRKVTIGGDIETIAGNGTAGFTESATQFRESMLNRPFGVFKSASGEVFFSDTYNHRIGKILTDGSIVTISGGAPGYVNGNAKSSQFNLPRGIQLSKCGVIFVSDSNNHVIRMIKTDGMVKTIAGTGLNITSGDGGSALSASLNTPWQIHLTSTGIIYVAEFNGNVIRMLTPVCESGYQFVSDSVTCAPICYGLIGSSACNGNGVCNSTNSCSCNPGWIGSSCSIAYCLPSLAVNDTLQCSNKLNDTLGETHIESQPINQLNSKKILFEKFNTIQITLPSDLSNFISNKTSEVTLVSSASSSNTSSSITSSVVTMTIFNTDGSIINVKNLASPIQIAFSNITSKYDAKLECVYFSEENKTWKTDGITTVSNVLRNESGILLVDTKCWTTHLTSFAVIDQNFKKSTTTKETTVPGLSDGTIIAITVSIVGSCIVLSVIVSIIAVATICIFRRKKKPDVE